MNDDVRKFDHSKPIEECRRFRSCLLLIEVNDLLNMQMCTELGLERWELFLDDKEEILKFFREKVKLTWDDFYEMMQKLETM